MKKLLILLLLGCAPALYAQDFSQNYSFVNPGSSPATPSFANTGVTSFFMSWSPQTSMNTCSVQADSSSDGSSWGNGDLIAAQTCTTAGSAALATLGTGKFFVRVRVTAMSGNGGLNVTLKGWGGGGGGITSVSSIPGEPGLTAIPVTSGLMGEYRILPTETAAGLLDYSGNGRNATGTTGTAPTMVAGTGGISCPGNGAVQLPSSLNGALTIQMVGSLQRLGTITFGGFGNFVGGNGGGTNSNAIGLGLTSSGEINQPIAGLRVESLGNSAQRSVSFDNFSGTANIALTMSALDHLYLEGNETSYAQTSLASAGLQTQGVYQICGAANGQGAAVNTFMPSGAIIYYLIFYNRVLTPQEITQNFYFMKSALQSRGVAYGLTTTGTGDYLLGVGDSIMAGSTVSFPFLSAVLIPNMTAGITAQAGMQIGSQILTSAANGGIDSSFTPAAGRNYLTIFAGTNDNCTPSANAVFENLAKFSRDRRKYGWKVFVVTMVSRTLEDTCKNSYNTPIRQQWPQFADGLIDFASDVNMGADGANTGIYFAVDHIHPSQTAHYNDLAPMVNRSVNRFSGAQSFSSANVYASAATAAVATTALSETGNTVTVTFGATPANCQVGNTITIAGVTAGSGTATGYNSTAANGAGPSGWLILTRSATQITYWDNTTGLGAATVQGTGVCPQQQPADQYMTLNFGAGNFTLDTCVGFTGQNIYLKNTNAGSSTIVPFGTETIDGAATVTIASKATLILQSILTSATAAGCSWQQLQNN